MLFASALLGGCISGRELNTAAYIGIVSSYHYLQYGHYNTRRGTVAIINETTYVVSVGTVTHFGEMVPLNPGEQQWFRCDVSGSMEVEAIARAMVGEGKTKTITTSFRLSSWGGKRSFTWVLTDEDFFPSSPPPRRTRSIYDR